MNYRHIYHAGNFADIFKHLILVAMINRLHKKETPYTVLDLYAGRGKYDLQSDEAQRAQEANNGIITLRDFCDTQDITHSHPLVAQYLGLVKANNPDGKMTIYPGSPLIINSMLAQYGELIASELNEEEYVALAQLFITSKKVKVSHLDAEAMVKKVIPFAAGRGLMLIDPPFEVKNEFDNIITLCQIIEKRAINLPVMIWYPIKDKDKKLFEDYTTNLRNMRFSEIIRCKFSINSNLVKKSFGGENGLHQCGVDIINPGDIADILLPNLKLLPKIYRDNNARISVDYIKPA